MVFAIVVVAIAIVIVVVVVEVLMDNFGNNLKVLRNNKGLSRKKLADVLNISWETIKSLEYGKHNPSINIVLKIAKYFEVSLDTLFFEEL